MKFRSSSVRVLLVLVVAAASVSCGGDEFEEGDGTGGSSPDGSVGSGGQGGDGSGGSSGGSGGAAGSTGGAGGSTGGAGGSAGGVSDASPGSPGDAGRADGSTGAGAVEIQQIQDGSIALGAEVRVEQVFITATRQQTSGGLNFVLQEPLGEASGDHPYPEYAAITAFAPPAIAAGIDNRSIGDCVNVAGTVDEFQEATQITVAALELVADCGTVPTPFNIITFADIATDVDVNAPGEQPGAKAEAFEGVLVEIQAIEAATAPDSAGLFRAVEQSNVTGPSLVISDFYYAIAATPGQHFASLTGIFTQFGSYQLNPRSIGDVVQ